MRQAAKAARDCLIVVYNDDGSIGFIGHEGDGLRSLVAGLDAALQEEKP